MKFKIIILLVFSYTSVFGQSEKIDYSYPPLIAGSSWGNIFQQYFKQGNYDALLKLTSDESIHKFGKDKILKYYQRMDFGYSLKLKSWTKDTSFFMLNYTCVINATTKIIRMRLSPGDTSQRDYTDTAKIVLPEHFFEQNIFLYK